MLKSLVERLNKDDNKEVMDSVITESVVYEGIIPTDSVIRPCSEEEITQLRNSLSSIKLDDSESVFDNTNKLLNAARNPQSTITEAIVSTKKTVVITKNDYNRLMDMVKGFTESNEESQRDSVKEFKKFIRKVISEIKDCNDDSPADALIIALTNKLMTLFDVKVDVEKDITNKYRLILKLNAIAKALTNIK